MASVVSGNPAGKPPDGYAAVPIDAAQIPASLRVAVLVRREAEPAGGHLVVLHEALDARVLLGCVVDTADRVHRWVELWIQHVGEVHGTADACREALSNAVLDKRWASRVEALRELDGPLVISTGGETEHPPPTFIDLESLAPVHPVHAESGHPWALCTDEAQLSAWGLPSYGSSLHRYLYVPALGNDTPVAPVTPQAPQASGREARGGEPGDQPGLVPLNPEAGLLMVRELSPTPLDAFADVLSGAAWQGLRHGRVGIALGNGVQSLVDEPGMRSSEPRLFLEGCGRAGRLVEALYLKLKLLADAVRLVRTVVQRLQRPVLNLTDASFAVRMSDTADGLPALWTARLSLLDAGCAVPLSIPSSQAACFLVAGTPGPSVYRPAVVGVPTRGQCKFRVRQVLGEARGNTILEGTIQTHEPFESSSSDLVWLRLALGAGAVDLYGKVEKEPSLAAGEWRFRSIGQAWDDGRADALRAAEGVLFEGVAFEALPQLSTPCDLFSLGVLAVRVLLHSRENSLATAADEMFSLARQASAGHEGGASLPERIGVLFQQDSRWGEALGPQHLLHESMSVQDAFGLVPEEVWYDTLAMVSRMFPGAGADSTCRDYGDAPAGGIHKVFDRAQSDLDDLLVRTRSLIAVDWTFNREVNELIAQFAR